MEWSTTKIQWMRPLVFSLIACPIAVLATGCSGAEEALDAIAGATGDGGKRVKLTGPIMGEQRMVCIDSPPHIAPAELQREIDKYLFKSIRWDSATPDKKTTVNKEIEDNRSCSYRISPYESISWDQFVSDAINQQLADWGNFSAKTNMAGQKHINVCMKDNECEDGDILAITLNGTEVARSELFKQPSCFEVPVSSGISYLGILAINGSGNKGACSYADRNTGEVTVSGATGAARTQLYSVRGGQGSYGSLTIVN